MERALADELEDVARERARHRSQTHTGRRDALSFSVFVGYLAAGWLAGWLINQLQQRFVSA